MNIILCNFNDDKPRLEKIDDINANTKNLIENDKNGVKEAQIEDLNAKRQSEKTQIDGPNTKHRLENIQVDESKTKQFKDLHDKEHNGNENFISPNIYENTQKGSSHKQNYVHPLEFRNISYNGRNYLDEVGEKALKARVSQAIKNKQLFDKGWNEVKYLENNLETKLLTTPISISTPESSGHYRYFPIPRFSNFRNGDKDRHFVYSKDGRIPVYSPPQDNVFPSYPLDIPQNLRGSMYDPSISRIVVRNYINPDFTLDVLRYNGYNSRKEYESPGRVYEALRHEAGHSINLPIDRDDVSRYYFGSKKTYGERPAELTNSMGLFKSEAYGQTGKIINNQKEYYKVLKENTFIGKDGKRYWKNTGDPVTVEAGRLINYIDSNKQGFGSMIEDNNLWEQVVNNNTKKSSNSLYS